MQYKKYSQFIFFRKKNLEPGSKPKPFNNVHSGRLANKVLKECFHQTTLLEKQKIGEVHDKSGLKQANKNHNSCNESDFSVEIPLEEVRSLVLLRQSESEKLSQTFQPKNGAQRNWNP